MIRTDPSWSCSQAVNKPVWHIPLLCVQWKTPDDGQRNCPKHVKFHSKNKFEKLVHLVGFIIRIYYNARSPERKISLHFTCWLIFLWNWGGTCFLRGMNSKYKTVHVKFSLLRVTLLKLPCGLFYRVMGASNHISRRVYNKTAESVAQRECIGS